MMRVQWQSEPHKWNTQLVQLATELGLQFGKRGKVLVPQPSDRLYIMSLDDGSIGIGYSSTAQLCRALGLLCETLSTGRLIDYAEQPIFTNLGVMVDASRGAVPNLSNMKAIMRQMASMGYNRVMLYTEDTYELSGEPWFGYLRGSYSIAELRELDAYAMAVGIELIPCIQTLAHLERFLHWPAAARYRDTNDILLADDPQTDTLLEKMFATLRSAFSSNRIHIGMDEAMGLGLGRHLLKHGFEPPQDIMQRHLQRVCDIAARYGFAPMMWSDMYFRMLSQNYDYYDIDSIPDNVCSSIPSTVQLVYWDYYHTEQAFYEKNLALHRRISKNTAFAGGAWNWLSPITDFNLFFSRSAPALEACKVAGVDDVWLTLWGDDGAEASLWSALPALQTYAEYCYTGELSQERICARFESCTSQDATPLLALSRFNRTALLPADCEVNAAKFLLYQDPLLGLLDEDIRGLGFASSYQILAKQYAVEQHRAHGHYKQLFEFYAQLAQVLAVKSELGISLRTAYHEGDTNSLARLADKVIPELCRSMRLLTSLWRSLWLSENKAIGWETHDIRLGGVIARLTTAQRRINDYLLHRVDCIEELENERMPYLTSSGQLKGAYFWQEIASASKL